MFSFFEKGRRSHTRQSSKIKKFSMDVREFPISGSAQNSGKIVKFSMKNDLLVNTLDCLKQHLIQNHQNCLFIMTIPSIRKVGMNFNYIFPGHNAAFSTNEDGQIDACISKRPNIQEVFCVSQRVLDMRFDGNRQTNVYYSQFTSVEEEWDTWKKSAGAGSQYPIYIHIIPFTELSVSDRHEYKKNVQRIKDRAEFYSLHSLVHATNANQSVPALNCNRDVELSIFGTSNSCIQDMFCQEAVLNIVERLIQDKITYHTAAAALGLMDGIEKSSIPEESYENFGMVI